MVFWLAYTSNDTVFVTPINTLWKNDVSQLANFVVSGSSYIYFILFNIKQFRV